jgi:hypothetical protein
MAGRSLLLAILLYGSAIPSALLHAEDISDAAESRASMGQEVSPEERLGATVTSVGKRHQKPSETAAAYAVTQEDIRRSGATGGVDWEAQTVGGRGLRAYVPRSVYFQLDWRF